jgi:hypothetical protein
MSTKKKVNTTPSIDEVQDMLDKMNPEEVLQLRMPDDVIFEVAENTRFAYTNEKKEEFNRIKDEQGLEVQQEAFPLYWVGHRVNLKGVTFRSFVEGSMFSTGAFESFRARVRTMTHEELEALYAKHQDIDGYFKGHFDLLPTCYEQRTRGLSEGEKLLRKIKRSEFSEDQIDDMLEVLKKLKG